MAGVAGYHPRLIDNRPDLIAQWHSTKNAHLNINIIGLYSIKPVVWVCDKKHEWVATVAQRTYQKQGCPFCSGRRPTPENNFAFNYPELAKQWHPTLNKKKPTEYTVYSSSKVWWLCKKGHIWKTTIASRSLHDCGCPECNPRDSKLQLFIYAELKYYYDAQYRYKVNGDECDIYLPSHQIAIEIDSCWWHKKREDKDKMKADRLLQSGIILISVRENGLKEISKNTIRYNDRDDKLIITKSVMKLLFNLIKDERLETYGSIQNPMNETYYLAQLANHPAPLFERSLAYVNPELAKQWDYEKNGGQTPSDVSANCNDKKWWKCDEGHSWTASVGSRNCHGCGCKQCYEIGRKKSV